MRLLGVLPLLLFLILLAMLPFAFGQVFTAALIKLKLEPTTALLVVVGIFMGFWLAKPIEGIGIAMPGLFPALLAALSALLRVPDQAPPVAFVAGVLGPLIGADLLHLRDIEKITTGIASIGGAGTFDGIVLSGIVAAYLA
ncbi:MAG: DUF1614 domain-containing protein [Nitrospira sp.]|nr:DUF1614 domain-containing protein [Nitrospira sp.]MDH4250435.1 DUF1614 domain-containing protein [Nitrospira sp.]MDH4343860.1 DUF1614 domain-containing protein [Nitrospira sp.]MDH5336917.1 DUF1614 domain-containing protein [Nitrospira sp.]